VEKSPKDDATQEECDKVGSPQFKLVQIHREKPPQEEVHHWPEKNVHEPRQTPLVEIQVTDEKSVDAMPLHYSKNPKPEYQNPKQIPNSKLQRNVLFGILNI
jgi:hypothetical protein